MNPAFQCQVCGVWQHTRCVQGECTGRVPAPTMCTQCRIHMADPFYVQSTTHYLPMKTSFIRARFERRQKVYQRGFTISQSVFNRLHGRGAGKLYLAIGCVLISDKVINRIHWPNQASVAFNGHSVRIYDRNQNKELSDNGRDSKVDLSGMAIIGDNYLQLSTADLRDFTLCVQFYEGRTMEHVQGLVKNAPEMGFKDDIKYLKSLMNMRSDEQGRHPNAICLCQTAKIVTRAVEAVTPHLEDQGQLRRGCCACSRCPPRPQQYAAS